MKPRKLSRAAIYLLCAVLVWAYGSRLEGTEFAGGQITGPLLGISQIGILLFVVALPLAFSSRNRIWAAVLLLAVLLCLPLYLYSTCPGLLRWVFRGEYKVPFQANFVWDTWSIIGIVALGVAAALGMPCVLRPMQPFSI